MSSTLAEQLLHTQRLQGTAAAAKKARGKPSLLFDAQKAADVDGETIYQIGCQGLAELCCLNQAYGALREALFSRSAASLVRDQQQPEALAQLDAAIHEFCSLLAQHFLAPCAFKALEYLIRRFKANEHNASSLLLAGLPYHATNEFVLLVKTIPLEATRGLWGWLAPIQTSGASLARSTLVARCINDPHLLTWLGEAARKLGTTAGRPSTVFLSFYATTMCEIIAETKVLGLEQVSRLLPCITYGLEAGASVDYRSATLMIVASLASRTTLSNETAKALVNSMLGSHPSRRGMDGLLLRVLALVCAKQPELKRIPDKALKALSQLPSLDQELLTLARDGVKTSALLNRLASSLVKRMASHPEQAAPVLLKLVAAGVLEHVAERLASQLLEQACPEDSSEEVSAGLVEATQQVLQALDTHYPTQTDTAVNSLLASTKAGTAPKAAKGDSSDEEEQEGHKEEAGQSQRAKAVFALVQSIFGHTAHVPCGDQAMTLTAAVTSPAAEVRKMALLQIGELLESGTATPAAAAQMHACILKGLEDEDPQVVAVAITLPSLRQLPIAALLPVLTPTALRASATFFTPTLDENVKISKAEKKLHEATKQSTKATRTQARAVLVGVLELLGTLAAGTGPGGETPASEAVQKELTDLALLLGLQCLLPVSHSITLCTSAAECLSSVNHPLLAQLTQLTTAAAKLQAEEAVMKSETAPIDKTGRKAWAARRAAAVNTAERSIINAVAQAVAEELTTLGPELSRVITVSRSLDAAAGSAVAAGNPALLRSRHVLTLAVNVALARAVKAGRKNPAAAAAAADLSMRLLHVALDAAASSDGAVSPDAWKDLIDRSIDSAGLPTEEHAQQLQAQPLALQQALVHHCLLAALENLPTGSDPSGFDLLDVFSQVASLEPQGDYDQHLALLLNRVCAQPQQRATFLAAIYCNPVGDGVQAKVAVVVAALRLAAGIAAVSMHHVAHVTTPVKARPAGQQAAAATLGGTTAEVTQAVMAHLPHMVAATSAPSETVRLAALDALLTVREALAVVPPATHPGVAAMAELLSCLQSHEQWITTDSTAVVALIRAALTGQQPTLPTAAVPSTPTKGGKRSGGKPSAAAASTIDAALAFLAQLLPHLAGSPHDLVAAYTLIQCLLPEPREGTPESGEVAGGAVTAGACLELLRAILSAAPRPLEPVQQRTAARALPVAFGLSAQPASASASASKVFLLALAASSVSTGAPTAAEPAWFDSISAVRLAAIRCLSSGQIPALLNQEGEAGAQLSAAVVQSLAVSAAGDVSIACRQAARAALEAMPIAATSVTPVLLAAQQQQQRAIVDVAPEASTPAKKKKQKKDVATATVPAAAVPIELAPPSLLEQAVLMLELLQWKAVSGEEQVVVASQELLSALQPTIAPLSQPHGTIRADPDSALPVPGDDDDDELNNANGRVNMPDASSSSSLAGYAAQLILQSLAGAAQRLGAVSGISQPAADAAADPAAAGDSKKVPGSSRKAAQKAAHAEAHGMDVFDLELVVRVAQAAPDGAARNAALSLLALLAGLAPQRAIKHVLEVLALVNASASTSDDAHSQQVAATTMASVVPTWVASGQDIMQLWAAVVAALPAMPAHRRLPLLATLLTAARTEASALPAGLLALLAHVVRVQEAKVAAKKAGSEGAEEGQGKEDEGEWGLELTAQLANQVPLQQRIQAFAALLRLVVQSERGQAHTPLARLAVTFITGQLQSKAVAGSALDHQQDEALQPACESLMAAALDCIRRLVAASGAAGADTADGGQPAAAAKGKGKATTTAAGSTPVAVGRKEERAVRTSIKGVYTLFEALQVVMPPHSYLQALLRLASQPVDRVRKRALRLFADRAARLPTDLKRIAEHPAYAAKAKAAAAQRLAQAALQIVPLVEQLGKELDSPSFSGNDPAAASALTHQSALAALSHVTTACGAGHAEVILAVVPSVLAHLQHPNGAVRGEALAVLASAVKACGAQLLPQLPATAKAIVGAGEAAAAALETEPAAARKRGKSQAEGGAQEAEEEGAQKESGGQLAAVELRAALEAIGALISQLGAFISPYLPAMLRVLLHPEVLSCQSSGCAAAAATVRASLPASVPSRLLLEPLFAALPNAADNGLLPVQALLSVVSVAVQRMDPTAAAAHADAVFAFLLRVLDMRSAPTPALKGLEHEAEASAVQALVALTLKLSEVKFKPLFLRFLEWASSPTASVPAGTAVGPNLGRLISLFTAAAALSEKLRSVFVPYFRHLIDLAVRHLIPQQHAAASKGSAKKRKQAGDAVPSPEATTPEWVLRIKIVRALHRCFLYDSVGWLDAEKVARLLPPLVAQLKEAPPAGTAAAAVAVQCRDRELDASVKFAERSPREDVAGVAAVAALVQMAVAANSDVHWKPLNYQVLMTTRTGGTRTRCLALEVVAHMVERLREEYLVMLPETLAFLSELLEDPDVAVESRVKQILASLEELGGEKLDQYLKK